MCYRQRGDKTSGFHRIRAVLSHLCGQIILHRSEPPSVCLRRRSGGGGSGGSSSGSFSTSLQSREGDDAPPQTQHSAAWEGQRLRRGQMSLGQFRHLRARRNLVSRLISGLKAKTDRMTMVMTARIKILPVSSTCFVFRQRFIVITQWLHEGRTLAVTLLTCLGSTGNGPGFQ